MAALAHSVLFDPPGQLPTWHVAYTLSWEPAYLSGP